MKGDFTGIRRWPEKHYTSVRAQQGRVQLDADWNDQVEIQQHFDRTNAVDVIGPAGGPKGPNGGFRITKKADGSDLVIAPGRFWVDGLLCELERPATYAHQPDLPTPPQVTSGALALADGTYVAYLDVWERHVTSLEDADLREPALRGVDTTTRTKAVWQLKLLKVADPGNAGTCGTAFPEWTALIGPPTGALSADAKLADAAASRCSVESTGGYTRLENQLYRVEIHGGGDRSTATFKWSRENGSVVTTWTKLTGNVLGVTTAGRDAVVGFTAGDWVELTDDDRESMGLPGVLVKLKKVSATELTIDPLTFDPPGTVLHFSDFKTSPKVRRWEGDLPTAKSAARALVPTPLGDGWVELEDGVRVKFESGTYRTGDYWVIPARSALGDVVWPTDPISKLPIPAPPQGIEHHYARLALVRKAGASLDVTSCYPQFPPLTAITASDVSFDNTTCSFNPTAITVQEAIDDLCKRATSGCTLVVREGQDLQDFFDTLSKNEVRDVAVCLTTGTWTLKRPVVVRLAGNVVLTGGGAGTRIVAPSSETALRFLNATSVVVRDLYAQTDVAAHATPDVEGATEANRDLRHLNGTLDFQGCAAVTVEGVSVRCGAALERAAACIAVRGSGERPPPSVRIRECTLSVGHRQAGILLLDVARARVEDNTVDVWRRPRRLDVMHSITQDKGYRSVFKKRLFSQVQVVPDTAKARVLAARDAKAGTLLYSLGGHLVRTDTTEALREPMREVVTSVSRILGAPSEVIDPHELANVLRSRAATPSATPARGVPEATPTAPIEAPGTGGTVARRELREIDPAVLAAARKFAVSRMPEGKILAALRRVVTARVIRKRLDQIATELLLSAGGTNAAIVAWVKAAIASSPAVASQGIVVGGTRASEVRIVGNTILGVLQGIHLGVSHGGPRSERDVGEAAWIEGNSVVVTLPMDWHRDRHGIFVGNFDSVVVQGNRLSLDRRMSDDRIDGIRIFGVLGRRVVVENNHLDRFTRGIWVHPLNPQATKISLWLVSRNVCANAQTAVVPEPSVRMELNVG